MITSLHARIQLVWNNVNFKAENALTSLEAIARQQLNTSLTAQTNVTSHTLTLIHLNGVSHLFTILMPLERVRTIQMLSSSVALEC